MAVREPGRFRVFDATAPEDEVADRIARAVDHLFDDPSPAGEPNRPVVRIHP
jgi:hypothetical protein